MLRKLNDKERRQLQLAGTAISEVYNTVEELQNAIDLLELWIKSLIDNPSANTVNRVTIYTFDQTPLESSQSALKTLQDNLGDVFFEKDILGDPNAGEYWPGGKEMMDRVGEIKVARSRRYAEEAEALQQSPKGYSASTQVKPIIKIKMNTKG